MKKMNNVMSSSYYYAPARYFAGFYRYALIG